MKIALAALAVVGVAIVEWLTRPPRTAEFIPGAAVEDWDDPSSEDVSAEEGHQV